MRELSKSLLIGLGGLALSISIATALFFKSNIPQDALVQILNYQLENKLLLPITVENIRGTYLTSITFEDVIYTPNSNKEPAFKADKVTLKYNPVKILFSGGKITPAISSIQLNGMSLIIHKQKNNKWNLAENIPSKNEGLAPPKFKPGATVIIENSTVHYWDDLGWKEKPIEKRFTERLNYFNAVGTVDKSGKLVLNGSGILKSTEGIATIEASAQGAPFAYSLSFDIDKVGLNKWTPYTVPFDHIKIKDDTIRVIGNIRHKPAFSSDKIPFWYDLQFFPKSATFYVSALDQDITSVNGKIHLFKGTLTEDIIKKDHPKLNAKAFISDLKNAQFIQENGQLSSTITPSLLKENKLSKAIPIIRDTPMMILFQNLTGNLKDIPLKGNGYIDGSKKRITLPLQSEAFDIDTFREIFPTIKNWKVAGNASINCSLFGDLNSPTFSGYLVSDDPNILGLRPEALKLAYRFQNKQLNLNILEGTLYEGLLSGEGSLQFLSNKTLLTLSSHGSSINMTSMIPNFPELRGSSDIQLDVSGTLENIILETTLKSDSAKLFNQHLSQVLSTVNLVQTTTSNIVAEVYLNKNTVPLGLYGQISTSNQLQLFIEGTQLSVVDIYPSANRSENGKLDIDLILNAPLNPLFWENPAAHTSYSFNGKLNKGLLLSHPFDYLEVSGTYDKSRLHIHSLNGYYNEQSLLLTGSFSKGIPTQLVLKLNDFEIEDTPYTQKKIPLYLQPFTSTLTGDLSLSTPTDNNSLSKLYTKTELKTNLTLTKTKIQNQPLEKVEIKGTLQNGIASIKKLTLTHNDTILRAEGIIGPKDAIDLNIHKGSYLNFNDFTILTAPFGKLLGQIGINGKVDGTFTTPNIETKFSAKNIQTEYVFLDSAKGEIQTNESETTLSNLTIKQNKSVYTVDGVWLMKGKENSKKDDYTLSLNVIDGEIESVYRLGSALFKEFKNQQNAVVKSPLFTKKDFEISDPSFLTSPISLYNLTNTSSLGFLDTLKKQHQDQSVSSFQGIQKIRSGILSGSVEASGKYKAFPKLSSKLEIKDLDTAYLTTEKATLKVTPGEDKISYIIKLDEGQLSTNPFDKLVSKGYFTKEGLLAIERTDISANNRKNQDLIKGIVPLKAFITNSTPTAQIDLNVRLENDEIGVLSIFNTGIQNISNTGIIDIELTGSIATPQITAKEFQLRNTVITLNDNPLLKKRVLIPSASISIKDNTISIPKLPLIWATTHQKNGFNHITLSGDVTLDNFTLVSPNALLLTTNLQSEPTRLHLPASMAFEGAASLQTMRLQGLLSIPLSKEAKSKLEETVKQGTENGPTLTGSVTLENGTLQLPKFNKTSPYPSVLFDLDLTLGKDLFVNGSLIGSGIFAGISLDLELESTKSPIDVKGGLNSPYLKQSIVFTDGSINLLNQNFELLKAQEQRYYLTDKYYENNENSVSFSTAETETGVQVIPVLNITARTITEEPEISSDNETIESDPKFNHIITRLSGPINPLDAMHFDVFQSKSDLAQSSPLFLSNTFHLSSQVQTQQSETTELIKLLFPEFYATGDFSEDFINKFGENRINLLVKRGVLRPIEKRIARAVGLYDLKIDYNIGQDIVNTNPDGSRKLGLSMIKNLSDQLYVRVKTDLDLQSEKNQNDEGFDISEIELNYFLLKNLSVNYANIRDEKREFKPKVSVKFSHDY